MNRRGFLGTLLGAGAAAALPSETWPFRKIFLPPAPKIVTPDKYIAIDVGDVYEWTTYVWYVNREQYEAWQVVADDARRRVALEPFRMARPGDAHFAVADELRRERIKAPEPVAFGPIDSLTPAILKSKSDWELLSKAGVTPYRFDILAPWGKVK